MASRLTWLTVCIPLFASGCMGLGQVARSYEDGFASIESIGRFDGWRQKVTPAELRAKGGAWDYLELGRRFEIGGGVPVDRDCAGYWYRTAFDTPYEEAKSSYGGNGQATGRWMETRNGLPQARVAYRKLLKGGAVDMGVPEARCQPSARAKASGTP